MKTEILKSYRRKDPLLVLIFLFFIIFFIFFRINSLEKEIGRFESKTNADVDGSISNYFGNLKLGEDYVHLKDIENKLHQKAIAESNQKSTGLEILNARIAYDEKVSEFRELRKEIEAFYPGEPDLHIVQNSEIQRLGYGYVRENSFNTPLQALHKLSGIYLGIPAVLFLYFYSCSL